MTALLQFSGRTDRKKGVELRFYLVKDEYAEVGEYKALSLDATEKIDCVLCDRKHPQLYVAWRKPVGTWGHWVVFRYLGEEHVPDLSIPIRVPKVPRGARKLSPEESSQIWHSK